MVLSDYVMTLILFGILAIPFGVAFSYFYEKSQKSKLVVIGLIFVYLILGFTSLHRNDCYIENVISCNRAHAINLSYDYCFQTNHTSSINEAQTCRYNLEDKCINIPVGCINKTKANIDGYCLSKIPYMCIVFNKV